jgi:hypothetical protein
MVHVPLILLSDWSDFPSAPFLAGQKEPLMIARVSILFKPRASTDLLPFSLCNKKKLAIQHMNRPPLPNYNIDSVLRPRIVGQAKDFLTPPRIMFHFFTVSQFTVVAIVTLRLRKGRKV